jgi:hypothetical protein
MRYIRKTREAAAAVVELQQSDISYCIGLSAFAPNGVLWHYLVSHVTPGTIRWWWHPPLCRCS